MSRDSRPLLTLAGIAVAMLGAIILAGGTSSRFGRSKALAELGNKPLIRHVIDPCLAVVDSVIVVVSGCEDATAYASILPAEVGLVKDTGEHRNPLHGLASGITGLDSEYTVVLACDTPFITVKVLELLFKKAVGFDAAVPRWPNDYIEPLHSVYRNRAVKEALPRITGDENTGVSGLVNALHSVRYVRLEEIRSVDPNLACFLNINTLQDLERARLSFTGQRNAQIEHCGTTEITVG
ncbi:molybdenum cofactor guanylyltransferase [Candidatus Bathyarchaeota archaeon]|nr:molybdenum cofactor guanylyltransferase [Candidatus Bathyarchaeota archaeon]